MCQRYGLIVGNRPGHVDRRTVEISRDAAGADALADRIAAGGQLSGIHIAGKRRTGRIGQRDAYVGLARFQGEADTGQRASGAGCTHESVHGSRSLFPDFLARGRLMPVAIGRVVELIGKPGTARIRVIHGLGESTRMMGIVLRIAIWHSGHWAHVRPGHAQGVDLLPALSLGQVDDRAIAATGPQQRQTDAGVASRAFDDHAAGAQQPTLLRIGQQSQSRAVLDRASGAEKFRLGKDLAAGHLAGKTQTQQRCVANHGSKIDGGRHGGTFRMLKTIGNLDSGRPTDRPEGCRASGHPTPIPGACIERIRISLEACRHNAPPATNIRVRLHSHGPHRGEPHALSPSSSRHPAEGP